MMNTNKSTAYSNNWEESKQYKMEEVTDEPLQPSPSVFNHPSLQSTQSAALAPEQPEAHDWWQAAI